MSTTPTALLAVFLVAACGESSSTDRDAGLEDTNATIDAREDADPPIADASPSGDAAADAPGDAAEPPRCSPIDFTSTSDGWVDWDVEPASDDVTVIAFARVSAVEAGGLFGVAQGAAAEFQDLPVAVRFSLEGVLDARNGAAYARDQEIRYEPNRWYRFELAIHLSTQTYDVQVGLECEPMDALITGARFRSDADPVDQLDTVAIWSPGPSTIELGDVLVSGGGVEPGPVLGAPISEPGLMGRGDVVYFQDFESAEWRSDVEFSFPGNFVRSSNVAFGGDSALVTRFPRESNTRSTRGDDANHYGGAMHFFFAGNDLPEPEEIYFRYYLYIPEATGPEAFPQNAIWDPLKWREMEPGYRPEDGQLRDNDAIDKMPGFGGIYAGQPWGGAGRGGNMPDGTDGWSARMYLQAVDSDTWRMRYYVYHLPDGRAGGRNSWAWDVTMQRATWHCIEGYVRLNTIIDPDGTGFGTGGNPDGILRGWVDGEPAFERTDLVFRFDDRLRVEEIYGNFYIGGGWFPIEDIHVVTDNWVVAHSPIGVSR